MSNAMTGEAEVAERPHPHQVPHKPIHTNPEEHRHHSVPDAKQPEPNPLTHVPEAVVKQRAQWWAPITLLIIVLIALYLVIDSGLINSNINLPFHVFNK